MSIKRNAVCALAVLFSVSLAHADDAMKADRQSVDDNCKTEAATAGCGSDKVGTGLLKCIGAYKQSHKDFMISQACKTARQQLRTQRTMRTQNKSEK